MSNWKKLREVIVDVIIVALIALVTVFAEKIGNAIGDWSNDDDSGQ